MVEHTASIAKEIDAQDFFGLVFVLAAFDWVLGESVKSKVQKLGALTTAPIKTSNSMRNPSARADLPICTPWMAGMSSLQEHISTMWVSLGDHTHAVSSLNILATIAIGYWL